MQTYLLLKIKSWNMKKLRIIARGANFNPITKKKYTDAELMCVNLYFEDIIDIAEDYNKYDIIFRYEEQYPYLKGWVFQILEIK